ncbi:MAG: hypothetical protein U5K31_12565 [Balneolaceae bacterium]|nr:hypothetical protein [Balneolaceae bacterium]
MDLPLPRLQAQLAEGQELRYVGRKASAFPAAGHMKIHQAEQERLVGQALNQANRSPNDGTGEDR